MFSNYTQKYYLYILTLYKVSYTSIGINKFTVNTLKFVNFIR